MVVVIVVMVMDRIFTPEAKILGLSIFFAPLRGFPYFGLEPPYNLALPHGV